MSSTNRGGKRSEADFYATSPWCVTRLLEAVNLPGGHWLDPCAGNGAIITATSSFRTDITWWASEIRPECQADLYPLVQDRLFIQDYFAVRFPVHFDVILTNPPYSLAERFLRTGLKHARYVALLLRLNFLSSVRRSHFMRVHPPDVYVLPNRPSFSNDGHTDSIEYAWFVYDAAYLKRPFGKLHILNDTPVSERRRT